MTSRAIRERIVLAYSGGLETTIAIPWLKERYEADVVAVTMDLGQGDELTAIRDRALASGAVRAHVLDVREEFVRRFVLPALQADALDEDGCPMASALDTPLIAERLVQIAVIEKAAAVAHGCAEPLGSARLEVALSHLNPALDVRSVVRRSGMNRPEQVAFARAHGVPLPVDIDRPVVVQANLWGRSAEWVSVNHASREPALHPFTVTRAPSESPDEPAFVDLTFERGVPTAINGVSMPLLELAASLSALAGAHGVGRIDRRDRLASGAQIMHVGEAPAAVLLHRAHQDLQRLVSPPELEEFGRVVSRTYAAIVHDGRWFSPLREALDAYVERVQRRVTGSVRLKLLKGDFTVVGQTRAGERSTAGKPAAVAFTARP